MTCLFVITTANLPSQEATQQRHLVITTAILGLDVQQLGAIRNHSRSPIGTATESSGNKSGAHSETTNGKFLAYHRDTPGEFSNANFASLMEFDRQV